MIGKPSEPTREQTNIRIGRILQRYHTFEEQRRAFGVLLRTGTPNWMMLANRQYMEWLLRNRENILRLRKMVQNVEEAHGG